jgi:hypothetical protein
MIIMIIILRSEIIIRCVWEVFDQHSANDVSTSGSCACSTADRVISSFRPSLSFNFVSSFHSGPAANKLTASASSEPAPPFSVPFGGRGRQGIGFETSICRALTKVVCDGVPVWAQTVLAAVVKPSCCRKTDGTLQLSSLLALKTCDVITSYVNSTRHPVVTSCPSFV